MAKPRPKPLGHRLPHPARSRVQRAVLASLAFLLLIPALRAAPGGAGFTNPPAATRDNPKAAEELRAYLTACFRKWDSDGDGVLTLSVEKAYAVVSREDLEAASRASIDPTANVKDLIGSSTHRDPYQGVVVHRSAVNIIPLLTGHACLVTNFSAAGADPEETAAAAHSLLGMLKRERRLVEVWDSPGLPRPKPLPGGHAYAMLDYDPASRTVTVFNPWGNNFTPENPPGLDNGYPTRNGSFQLPLDHFLKLFHHICYETSEPAPAR